MVYFRFWDADDCILSVTMDHDIALQGGDTLFLEEVSPAEERSLPLTEYEVQDVHTSIRKKGGSCRVVKDVGVLPKPSPQ